MRLSLEQMEQFSAAVEAARGRADLHLAIDCIYQQLQDAITLRKPRCDASGRCCRFEEFGHRLFITTAEMAVFLDADAALQDTHVPSRLRIAEGCVFQINGRCSVHAIRPFGCRIFFCDPTADSWQTEQYEQMHKRIRALHDELHIPYFYVEWREALRCVAGTSGSSR